MRLSGVELRNFRSIGAEPVVLRPLRKCNILVGQNNAGKSNVLRAIKLISDKHRAGGNAVALSDLDLHRRSPDLPFLCRLWFEADTSIQWDATISRLAGTDSFWFDVSWQQGKAPAVTDLSLAHVADFGRANALLEKLVNLQFRTNVGREEIRNVFQRHSAPIFDRFSPEIPVVHMVPEFRRIRSGDKYVLDGAGLIDLLAHYRVPEIGKDEDQSKFERIQEFMRRLLHLPQAILEITPSNPPTIVIKDGSLRLPLESYGTGVHELVILVTAVTSVEGTICCIEEPEIHLHPRLQRQFIEFLVHDTSNQYLISTHSPTLINMAGTALDVQVFFLQSRDGATTGGPVLDASDCVRAVRDLGIRPSDVLHANSIIWVEGPSDQVYIRRWIELLAPDLEEGQDYVFMPWSRLRGLSIDRDRVAEDLVNVLRMNQNAVVVMDSDREAQEELICNRKREVAEKCEQSGGISWVTDGREIENYIPSRVVVEACKEIRGCEIEFSLGPYDEFERVLDQALKKVGKRPMCYALHKLDYSRKFAEYFTLDDMSTELKQRVGDIVDRIRQWSE